MKNLTIKVIYKWIDEKGEEVETEASIGGDWFQWGGTQEQLAEIMPLTEKLNEVANEFIAENCENETDEE
jgi:hypothetical protein